METDDLLCEAPGPSGMTCTKPYGHDGTEHEWEVELPPDAARIVETMMTMMEKQHAEMVKQTRWLRKARYAMYFAVGLNLLAFLVNMLAALARIGF